MKTNNQIVATPAASAPPGRMVFGHPRGLYTLFFTEMWERFSYYGMRALLVLFMEDAIRTGGLGYDTKVAGSIYGLYTAFVYLVALPGGWIADRLLGAQRSIYYGGIVIAAGHFTLAIPSQETFFLGLLLVVLGTGLLKPNISAIVGQLYPEGGARRDAGFTIFYLGINLGAAIGPLVCSFLGEKINWHYGFGAAGVGMVFGLIQYRLTRKYLGTAGLAPERSPSSTQVPGGIDRGWYFVAAGLGLVALVVVLALFRVIRFDPVTLAQGTTYVIVAMAAVYFTRVFAFGQLTALERRRVVVIIVLFIAAAMFWSGFEQAGSSLNLFAERHTDRWLDWFNYEVPAGWFQFFNPFFIITLAPVFSALWVVLARRNVNPSIPVKFALGLILLALGFMVIGTAAKLVVAGNEVAPWWLIFTYLLHTIGEICLSPVGLSSVTKLAPPRFVGQMMGTWFLAASLGNLIAGLVAGEFDPKKVEQMPGLYFQFVLTSLATGILLLLFSKPIKKLIGDIK